MQTIKWTNQNSKQIHIAHAKHGKTCVSKSWLVLVLFLIGWESGARFFSHSQSVAVQNQSNCDITFDTQLKTALNWVSNFKSVMHSWNALRNPRGKYQPYNQSVFSDFYQYSSQGLGLNCWIPGHSYLHVILIRNRFFSFHLPHATKGIM